MLDINRNGIDDALELRARGNWSELKGKIKKANGNLTDDDLEYQEGQQDEWYGKLSNKLGKTVDDVRNWIAKL